MVEQPELAVRQGGDHVAEPGLPPRDVEREWAHANHAPVLFRSPAPKLRMHTREQLVEGERLREVVACAEAEATQFCLQVRAGRDDHHRYLGMRALELAQDCQAV